MIILLSYVMKCITVPDRRLHRRTVCRARSSLSHSVTHRERMCSTKRLKIGPDSMPGCEQWQSLSDVAPHKAGPIGSSLDTAFEVCLHTLLESVRHQLQDQKRPLPSLHPEAAMVLTPSQPSTAPTASALPQPLPAARAPVTPPPWIVPLRVTPPPAADEEEHAADSDYSWFPLAPVSVMLPGLQPEAAGWRLSCSKVDRVRRCGACEGCRRADCGRCSNCRDKKQNGGAGIKKQSCTSRRCLNPTRTCMGRDKTKPVHDATPDAATKPITLPHRQPSGVGSFTTSTLADFLSDLAEIL